MTESGALCPLCDGPLHGSQHGPLCVNERCDAFLQRGDQPMPPRPVILSIPLPADMGLVADVLLLVSRRFPTLTTGDITDGSAAITVHEPST